MEEPSRASVYCKDGYGTMNSFDAYRLGTGRLIFEMSRFKTRHFVTYLK